MLWCLIDHDDVTKYVFHWEIVKKYNYVGDMNIRKSRPCINFTLSQSALDLYSEKITWNSKY